MSVNRITAPLVVLILLVAWLVLAGPVLGAESPKPQFGISSFQLLHCADASSEDGLPCDAPYTQAGGTPYELTTTLDFNVHEFRNSLGEPRFLSVEEPKDIKVSFPAGVVFNPQAAPRCPVAVFDKTEDGHVACPASSQVGTILTNPYGHLRESPVYNLTPLAGRPAEFGFHSSLNFAITGGVNTGEGYTLSAISSDIPEVEITTASITVWGYPADSRHDEQRGQECRWLEKAPPEQGVCEGGDEAAGGPLTPFVRLPTECSGQPLAATIQTDSWAHPGALDANDNPLQGDGNWKTTLAEPPIPPVTGCGQLSFGSSLVVQPDSTAAGEPVGLGVELSVPQTESPEVPGTPDVRDVTVALPEGMVVSPSAAQGLGVCRDDPGVDPREVADEFGSASASPASCEPKLTGGAADDHVARSAGAVEGRGVSGCSAVQRVYSCGCAGRPDGALVSAGDR